MNKKRLLWTGVALAVLIGATAVLTRGMGFTARGNPSSLEARLALAARRWATPRSATQQANPVAASADALKDGMAHWADHCATCHANDGSGKTSIGRSLYPPAPDMREPSTQTLSDGELFYVIERGVPFTGMPAWGTGTPGGEEDSWKLVHFIRHLPKLTPADLADMEKLNPKSAGQIEMEHQIQDFLKGRRR